jgi:hypothetical protein
VKLGPTPVQFPVKVTEPLTAILYITGRAGEHGLTRVLARLDCVNLIDAVQYDRVQQMLYSSTLIDWHVAGTVNLQYFRMEPILFCNRPKKIEDM